MFPKPPQNGTFTSSVVQYTTAIRSKKVSETYYGSSTKHPKHSSSEIPYPSQSTIVGIVGKHPKNNKHQDLAIVGPFSARIVLTATFTSFFGGSWTTATDPDCTYFLLMYQTQIVADYISRFAPNHSKVFFSDWQSSQDRVTRRLSSNPSPLPFLASTDTMARSILGSSLGIPVVATITTTPTSRSSSNASTSFGYTPSSSFSNEYGGFGADIIPSPEYPFQPSRFAERMSMDSEAANDGLISPASWSGGREHNLRASSPSFVNILALSNSPVLSSSSFGIGSGHYTHDERSLPLPGQTRAPPRPAYIRKFEAILGSNKPSYLSINECCQGDIHKMFWDLDMYTTCLTLSPDDLCLIGIICRVIQMTVRNFYMKIDPNEWTKDGTMVCRRTEPRPIHTLINGEHLQTLTDDSFVRLTEIYSTSEESVSMARQRGCGTLAANDETLSHKSSGTCSSKTSHSATSRPLSGFGVPPQSSSKSSSLSSTNTTIQSRTAEQRAPSSSQSAISFDADHFVLETMLEAQHFESQNSNAPQTPQPPPCIFTPAGTGHVESKAVVDAFLAQGQSSRTIFKVGINCHFPGLAMNKERFEVIRQAAVDALVRVVASNPSLVQKSHILMHSRDPLRVKKDVTHLSTIKHWLDVCDSAPIRNGQCRLIFSRKSSPCVRCGIANRSSANGSSSSANSKKRARVDVGGLESCHYCSGSNICDAGPDAVSTPFIHINGRGTNLASMDIISSESMNKTESSRELARNPLDCHLQGVFSSPEIIGFYNDRGWDIESAKSELQLSKTVPYIIRFLPLTTEPSKVRDCVGEWIRLTSIRIPSALIDATRLSPDPRASLLRTNDFWLPKDYCWCRVYQNDIVDQSIQASRRTKTLKNPTFGDSSSVVGQNSGHATTNGHPCEAAQDADKFSCSQQKHDNLLNAGITKQASKYLETALQTGVVDISRPARTTNVVYDLSKTSPDFRNILDLICCIRRQRTPGITPSLGFPTTYPSSKGDNNPRLWALVQQDIYIVQLRHNFGLIGKSCKKDVMRVLDETGVRDHISKYDGPYIHIQLSPYCGEFRRRCLCKIDRTGQPNDVHSSSAITFAITSKYIVQVCMSFKCHGLCAVIGLVPESYSANIFTPAVREAASTSFSRR